MVAPVISPLGRSFKGAVAYYAHDKGADTTERVGATFSLNLGTNNPETAWRIMAYTAKNAAGLKRDFGIKATGRTPEFPVFSMAIPWHPEQNPTTEQKFAAAISAVEYLGLSDYQVYGWEHLDEPQPHIHVIANRVHPKTGKMWDDAYSHTRIQAWALKYQREHGETYCPQREVNARKRDEHKLDKTKPQARYRDPVMVEAWEQSDNGKSFQAALHARGYRLARGDKRDVVIVDPWGKPHGPTRRLGVKAKEFKKRISDLDTTRLPTVKTLQDQAYKQAMQERRAIRANKDYDARVIEIKNEMQDRHIQQRAKLSDKFHRRLLDKKQELTAFYKFADRRAEIQRLKALLKKPDIFRKLSGKEKADREELERLEGLVADSTQKMADELEHIEMERARAYAEQEKLHAEEQQRALEMIEELKPDFYREEILKEHLQDQENTRSRGGGRSRSMEL